MEEEIIEFPGLMSRPAEPEDEEAIFQLNRALIDRYESVETIPYEKVLDWVRREIRNHLGVLPLSSRRGGNGAERPVYPAGVARERHWNGRIGPLHRPDQPAHLPFCVYPEHRRFPAVYPNGVFYPPTGRHPVSDAAGSLCTLMLLHCCGSYCL